MAQQIGKWNHKGSGQWVHENGQARVYLIGANKFALEVNGHKRGKFDSRDAAMDAYSG